jgi:hypothetical protein
MKHASPLSEFCPGRKFMRQLFAFIIIATAVFALSSCVPYIPPAAPVDYTIKTPADWPTVDMTETDFRAYFDTNKLKLNPIEGIWSVNSDSVLKDLNNGLTSNRKNPLIYRIAIMRSSIWENYEYVAVILESASAHWTPKLVKAHFRSTANDTIFEGLWYQSDFSRKLNNHVFDKDGFFRSSEITVVGMLETRTQMTLIKIYPRIEQTN